MKQGSNSMQVLVPTGMATTSSAGGGAYGGGTGEWNGNGGWIQPYIPHVCAPIIPQIVATPPPRVQAATEALKLPNTAENKKLRAAARKVLTDYLDGKIAW